MVTEFPGEPEGSEITIVGVTVKLVVVAWLIVPVARIEITPFGAGGMAMSALQTPLLSAVAPSVAKPPPISMVMRSLALTPEPEILTNVPGGPLVRSRLTPAPMDNWTEGTLDDVDEPDALTLWLPAVVVGTVNELDH